MKLAKKLSPAVVEAAHPEADPYRIWDTAVPQLHLRVQPTGIKSWNVQWSRTSTKSLGKWPGVTVESARTRARALLSEVDGNGGQLARPKRETMTVADACRDYVAATRKEGREATAVDAERRFARVVYADRIGKIKVAHLTQDDVEGWRDRVERGDLAALPTTKGRPPQTKPLSKATANRMRTALVAALNRAVERRHVKPDAAIEWNSVKPHKGAGNRRELYLTRAQRRALLDAADGAVRDLVECVALTGCRPGDPAACLRKDFDARNGVVTFRTKGHVRKVPLTPAANALFLRLAKDKLPAAHLFVQDGGRPWTSADWSAPIRAAAATAKLPEGVTLYSLRHAWITDSIVAGLDLLTVAKLAGTSLQMIEQHYGHLVQDAARDKLAAVEFL